MTLGMSLSIIRLIRRSAYKLLRVHQSTIFVPTLVVLKSPTDVPVFEPSCYPLMSRLISAASISNTLFNSNAGKVECRDKFVKMLSYGYV
jgi:hypothetical protein